MIDVTKFGNEFNKWQISEEQILEDLDSMKGAEEAAFVKSEEINDNDIGNYLADMIEDDYKFGAIAP